MQSCGAAFLSAAKCGDETALLRLLSEDRSLLHFSGKGTSDAVIGSTALHWAAAKGHAGALKLLINEKADVHARNNGDSTPLASACLSNHPVCARLLLEAGASATLADEFGDTPFSLAKRAGHAELIALLSGESSAPPAAAPPPPPATAAGCKQKGNDAFNAKEYDAAIGWYASAINLTVEGGDGYDTDGLAALFSNRSACYTALRRFEEALEDGRCAVRLRPAWAKAHSRMGAALIGLDDLEGALAAYKAALEAEPSSDIAQGQLKEIKVALRTRRLEALIERGAFEKKRDDEEAEAARMAGSDGGSGGCGDGGSGGGGDGGSGGGSGGGGVGGGTTAGTSGGGGGGTVCTGAAAGAATVSAKREKTPEEQAYKLKVSTWMKAAKGGDVATLERCLAEDATLLSNRSERTGEQQLGNSALHWAAAHSRLDAVRWLVAREGADVNWRNNGGGTPLHSATAHARAEVASLLLEAGADVGAKDENGDTPRDAASRRGYRTVEAVLDRGPVACDVRWAPSRTPRPDSEAAAKALGNAAFAQGDLSGARAAVGHYTDALLLHRLAIGAGVAGDATSESVLLSNRSAAHAKLAQYHAALEDADAAVALRPTWGKAHGRRGAALLGLGDARKAEAAFHEGLGHEPGAVGLQEGLAEARGKQT